MPSSGDPTPPLPPEDAFLELLIETLEGLDRPARAQFLQRYLKSIAQLEFSEEESIECWERILARRAELTQLLGRPVPLKTAMVDVLASSRHLRMPVLMEYEELKRLQISAGTDPLTGLYNRRVFEEYFDRELNRARRYGHKMVVVIQDLHLFKEVNDRYGHPRGDQVLQATAATLRKSLRTSDYAFRIGGDEFALLLPESDLDQALTLSRRVSSNLQAELAAMNLGISLSLDFGVAVYPDDGDQKEILVRTADKRLYQMKHAAHGQPPGPETKPAAHAPAVEPPPRRLREQVLDRMIRATTPEHDVERTEKAPPPRAPAAEHAPGEHRRWERVSLSATRAYAAIGEAPKNTRILDLGYGGVALETPAGDELANYFQAILHVPILPPVRVTLKRIYVRNYPAGTNRIGCSFATEAPASHPA